MPKWKASYDSDRKYKKEWEKKYVWLQKHLEIARMLLEPFSFEENSHGPLWPLPRIAPVEALEINSIVR